MSDNYIIQAKDVQKYYNGGEIKALDGVTASVRKGEVVVIIGPSGSGKSTFLRCLNLLELPTGGQILFEGTDITDKNANINLHRQKMGMVFQHFNLFPHKTILENITLAPIKLLGKSKEEAEKQAMELLRRVGLEEKANAYPSRLSGGQKQRVAIARALAIRPAIILADEPTGSLDSRNRWDVFGLLKRASKEYEQTIVMITHDQELAMNTDKMYRIEDGQIVKEG